MLVKHKNIAIQTGFELAGNHNVVYRVACLDGERPNRSSYASTIIAITASLGLNQAIRQ